MDIDLVYLWVDGNDPVWQIKRNACIGKPTEKSGTNCEGRYANNDELKYSLRSIEMYAPWMHRIFIITDNQTPSWLNTAHPKVKIVDHTDIIPKEYLPNFNSTVLEHFLHKIPELSEYFLYSNDDMFLNKPVTPSIFFRKDGLPIIRLTHSRLRDLFLNLKKQVFGVSLKNYIQIIRNAAYLVKKKYGTFYSAKPHHNIDAYLKSDYEKVERIFQKEINETLHNHLRSSNDIHRSLYNYVALAEKRCHPIYVTQKTSFRFHIQNHKHYEKLEKYNPVFFCMNDSEYANDNDRRKVKEFLSKRFAQKSQFEK